MKANPTSFGDFSIFGITKAPINVLKGKFRERLSISPKVINLGSAGHLCFYTSYGDVAESESEIVLRLGLAHTPQGEPLLAQQILDQGLISRQSVDDDGLMGNALVAWFSKTTPEFSVYKTLHSNPQLYFSRTNGGIMCTDGPRPHLALLDHVNVNPEAIAQHFLFRYVLGRHTYFEGIERLLPGELFQWRDDTLDTRLVRDLRPKTGKPSFNQIDPPSLAALQQEMSRAIRAYVRDIEQTGYDFGTMLSGGVDSTLLQLLVRDNSASSEPSKSFSYVIDTPEFEFEIGYAREAAELLGTDHTFVHTTPEAYPELLVETIETLGFPIPAESYPCKLSIAKYSAEYSPNVRYFFLGNGADSLYGTNFAKKIALLEQASHIPASGFFFQLAANVLKPVSAKKAHGLRQVAGMLAEIGDPLSYKLPMNTTAVYTDLETARRSFGDEALKQALDYRHYLEGLYLGSRHFNEKTHMIELFTDAYECSVVTNHLYLAHGREQIYPFMDEAVMRIGLAFDPSIRLINGRHVKPLLKGILEQNPRLAGITKKRKGASVFNEDVHVWMREGSLRDLVLSIDRPGFLSKSDFDRLLTVPTWSELDDPNWFLWNLLVFDIFQKCVINQ